MLALVRVLLMVDQRPLIEPFMPVSKPTAAKAINANNNEYSTISWPESFSQRLAKWAARAGPTVKKLDVTYIPTAGSLDSCTANEPLTVLCGTCCTA